MRYSIIACVCGAASLFLFVGGCISDADLSQSQPSPTVTPEPDTPLKAIGDYKEQFHGTLTSQEMKDYLDPVMTLYDIEKTPDNYRACCRSVIAVSNRLRKQDPAHRYTEAGILYVMQTTPALAKRYKYPEAVAFCGMAIYGQLNPVK